ncbi:MAG: hypothetical protein U0X74_10480 [Anaerolineales bacterium]
MYQRTKEEYLSELYDIRDKLIDFSKKVSEGKGTYYKDIALKLRILYCLKSGTKPLLETIQNLFGFDIFVAVTYSVQEQVERGLIQKSLADGLVFQQINSVATWFERGHELENIFDALKRDEIFVQNYRYSYKKVIEVAADKMAAHIDPKIPIKDLELHSSNLLVGGLPVAQRAIFDTARASILLITIIENFISNKQENHFIRLRK